MNPRVVLFLYTLVSAACGQYMTILEFLRKNNYHLFLNYVQQAGLTDILNGTGPFTLFGPANYYFYPLDYHIQNDTAKINDVIKYQVASGLHRADDININENQLESLQGTRIRINHYYSVGKYAAGGKEIFAKDYLMSNGVIHFLREAMYPPIGTVMDVLSADGELSTLLSAVNDAGLGAFLQDHDPVTVFAPTDKAFTNLSSNILRVLRSNQTLMTSVLRYHVIPGTLYAIGYHPADLHTFLEGDRIKLAKGAHGYEVDNSELDREEFSATNGVVHKIDQVLIPRSLSAQINALTSVIKT